MKKLIAFILAFYAAACLGDKVSSYLDRDKIQLGESLSLSYEVSGDLTDDFKQPEIEGVDFSGHSTSTSLSWINGNRSQTTTHTFSLTPRRAGQFRIPSIHLKIDGQVVRTNELTFVVKEASNQVQSSQSSVPDAFIVRNFSKKEAYVGEPIVSEIKIYHRQPVAKAESSDERASEFRYIDMKQQNGREVFSNHQFNVIVLRRTLVPFRSGEMKLPAYQVHLGLLMPAKRRRVGSLFDFFNDSHSQVVRRTLSTKPKDIQVKPLPKSGRPDSFRGIVGQFRSHVKLTQHKVTQGETTTLTVTIKGYGSLDSLGALHLDIGKGVKAIVNVGFWIWIAIGLLLTFAGLNGTVSLGFAVTLGIVAPIIIRYTLFYIIDSFK